MSYQYTHANKAKRQANPDVIRQFNTCIAKLEDAKEEYKHSKLGNSRIATQIRQTILTLNNLERELYL